MCYFNQSTYVPMPQWEYCSMETLSQKVTVYSLLFTDTHLS